MVFSDMLSKNVDAIEPCIRCDSDSLKVMNVRASNTRCVGVRFRMSRFCSRCECDSFMEKMAYWQSKICDDKVDVNVGIPLGTYGSVDRAVQASRIAAKGSEFRAHGSLVSHVQLLKTDEIYKIALCRWVPYAMNKVYRGEAKISMPLDESFVGNETDYTKVIAMHDKYANRVTPVLKRLRKLREDEVLTLKGKMLMRQTMCKAREQLLDELHRLGTDDVFKLEYVEIRDDKENRNYVPQFEEDEAEIHAREICQAYDGRISEIQSITQARIDGLTWEIERMQSMIKEMAGKCEAEATPDIGKSSSVSSLDTDGAITHQDPRYDRNMLLGMRPGGSGRNVNGFDAMNKHDRRRYRVLSRS